MFAYLWVDVCSVDFALQMSGGVHLSAGEVVELGIWHINL